MAKAVSPTPLKPASWAQVLKSTYIYQVNHACFTFVKHQILAFINDQPLRRHPFDIKTTKNHPSLSKFEIILGFFPLGWIFSLIIATGTFLALALGLIFKHSFISFYRTIVYRINAAFKDMYVIENGEKKPYEPIFIQKPLKNSGDGPNNLYQGRNKKQLALGLLGRMTGFILGAALFILLVIGRMLWNTPEHIYRSFCRGVCALTPEETSLHAFFKLKQDKRAQPNLGYGASYALGILGIFPLGLVSGVLGLVVGLIFRFSILFNLCYVDQKQSNFNDQDISAAKKKMSSNNILIKLNSMYPQMGSRKTQVSSELKQKSSSSIYASQGIFPPGPKQTDNNLSSRALYVETDSQDPIRTGFHQVPTHQPLGY